MTQTTTYLRYPHLSGSTLTFIADDDVWLTDLPGFAASARAWRVTSDRVPVKRPLLSPDGSRVAWTSAREGVVEAFALPVDGGETHRLTYWGHPRTEAIGWASPDEVIVRGWGGHGHRFYSFAHTVPFEGGQPTRLPYGNLKSLAVAEPGVEGSPAVLSRFYAGNSWLWKGYRGGATGQLWIDRRGTGEFERFLADLDGNLGDPMWFDGRVVFHSDHEDGVAELYSALPDGTDLRRHTTGEGGYYLRNAMTDGVRIVFQRAGRLWVMEDLEDDPRALDIRLPGARTATTSRPIDAAQHLGAFSPDHTGRASAVEVRGTVHWLTHKDGPARALGVEAGVRGRLPVVLGATGQTAWVTDAGGQYSIEIAAVNGADGAGSVDGADSATRRRILTGEFGYVNELVASPDGKHLAAATRDNKLLLIDVEGGTLRVVTDGEGKFRAMPRWGVGFVSDPAFSPDSRWLAWSQRSDVPDAWQIRVADVASLETLDITEPRFRDWNPVFTADGKHLAFLSARTLDSFEEDMYFDYSFLPSTRPYLVPLAETEPSPFDPELGGRPVNDGDGDGDGSKNDGADGEKKDPATPPATVIDTFGITTRAVPFPVASGTYADLAAVKGGVVWLAKPVTGALGTQLAGSGRDQPRPALVRFDFGKREEHTLIGELDGYAVSGDGARLVVADHGALTTRPADKDDDDAKPETVDLSRIRLTVVPAAEREQAFEEAWRLQVENYVKPNMDGIDWQAARSRYAPLVAATATDDDFVDLLWELQGELRTSHAYVDAPKSARDDTPRKQGLLGADLAPDEDGVWRIVRILPGDNSVPAARSPLLAPGIAARVGDAITAVDGLPVPPRVGPAALLAGKADQPTELVLQTQSGNRTVVVVPIADEVQLRYRAWVADRRAYVLEKSGGRLGYVHLPDQAEAGWAEFHRDLSAQVVKDGLVVDTRGNRGGITSSLVVERLLRKPLGWEFARGELPDTYPPYAPPGPVVSVCDEEAGSDGDIINQAFKDHGMTVVGTRTWGGVIGMDDCFYLMDGTFITQPRYALAFNSVGLYGLENHGCEPTVTVDFRPQDFVADLDPQLDKAIEIALEALAKEPAAAAPSVPGVYEH